ncbi:unnamed protein product [Nesidiocoris tenuis]|uniref:Uncharacterized protein n=1 Tax=Nesidiocoris tenuis TaxID=355587 RepID=A0A6H5GI50_9HEMI|nr:unnamed protein product [Nesidiocoris tenuis]
MKSFSYSLASSTMLTHIRTRSQTHNEKEADFEIDYEFNFEFEFLFHGEFDFEFDHELEFLIMFSKLLRNDSLFSFVVKFAELSIIYIKLASPPDRNLRDERSRPSPPPASNGQLNNQGPLTIVRRSSGRRGTAGSGAPNREAPGEDTGSALETLDLDTEHQPPFDTPDACDKAALRYVPYT